MPPQVNRQRMNPSGFAGAHLPAHCAAFIRQAYFSGTRMIRMQLFFLFVCGISLPLYARGAKLPAWVENPFMGYAENEYIAATGAGMSADEADKKAVAAVAAAVIQNVNMEETVTQSSLSDGTDLTSYLSDIRIQSKLKDVTGLSIKDRWTAKNKPFYSRAVLDKNAAGRQYALRLQKNAAEIDALLEASGRHPATFESCKTLIQAYALAAESDYYLNLLSVLRPNARPTPSYGSAAAIETRIRSALSDIKVLVTVSGDSGGRLAAAVASVINGLGAGVTASENDAAYRCTTQVSYEDIEKHPQTEIYFTRFALTCAMTECTSGKDILTLATGARCGKLSRKEAQQNARAAAEQAVKDELSTKLNALLK